MSDNWFEVSRDGLRAQITSKPNWFLNVTKEIVANYFDKDSAQTADLNLEFKDDKAIFQYQDDGKGFERWSDIYTLFAPSTRIKDRKKRGRFNLGEKYFFATSDHAWIRTSGIRINFNENGTRSKKDETGDGTTIYAVFSRTEKQMNYVISMLESRIIVPNNKLLAVNSQAVQHREIIKAFEDKLLTVEERKINPGLTHEVLRSTRIEIFDKLESEKTGWLYELWNAS